MNESLSTQEISAFLRYFSNWDDQILANAVHCHMTDPKVGMYRIMPAHIQAQLDNIIGPIAEKAWQVVLKAASQHGINDDVKFSDPLIMQSIVDAGGWRAICMESNEFRRSQIRKDFVSAYYRYNRLGLSSPPPDVFRGALEDRRLISVDPQKLLSKMD